MFILYQECERNNQLPYKHVVISKFGGPEVLELVEEKNLPEPGPGEVRIEVLAAGTGFTDTIIRKGQYPAVKEKPPFTIGYDWVGTVEKLGDGVTGWRSGDMAADLSIIGGYTQYHCVDADKIVAIPGELDPAEAVCMILSYGTAYQMLTRLKTLSPGDSCLVHAAGGAVVFDTIGAANWSRSYRCLKKGGLLVGFGALQVTTGEESIPALILGFLKLLGLWKLIPDGKRTCFYNIQSRREKKPQEFQEDIATLMDWLKDGQLKPAIAARRPLADARAVHRDIDGANIAGKVILMCQE